MQQEKTTAFDKQCWAVSSRLYTDFSLSVQLFLCVNVCGLQIWIINLTSMSIISSVNLLHQRVHIVHVGFQVIYYLLKIPKFLAWNYHRSGYAASLSNRWMKYQFIFPLGFFHTQVHIFLVLQKLGELLINNLAFPCDCGTRTSRTFP